MFSNQITKITNIIYEKEKADNVDKDVIAYGISTIIEVSLSVITSILLGIMLKLTVESVTFMIAFSAIRTFSGGYHCKNAETCYFLSSGVVFLILLIIKYVSFQVHLSLIILLVCVSIAILTIYAPVETKSRPLDEKEQKYFRKKTIRNMCFEIIIGMGMYFLGFKQYSFIIALAIILSGALVVVQKVYLKVNNG